MGSPVSPIVANLYMEWLEQRAIATAPQDCKPRIWKRYVDDIFEVIRRGATQRITDHINTIDETGNTKFTFEEEVNGSLPFLDLLATRTESGVLKTTVYRKKTHTDQYLNFTSQHALNHKLSVIRTLLDCKDNIVSNQPDRETEEAHIKNALGKCGYLAWAFTKVEQQRGRGKNTQSNAKAKQQAPTKKTPPIVLPYIQGITEPISRFMKQAGISTASRPHTTVKQLLVHPKDKPDMSNITDCVYQIPCGNCPKSYFGETGRKFGTWIKEHQTDVSQNTDKRQFTRSQRKTSLGEFHKSAITDHVAQDNHSISWRDSKVIDREPNRYLRWIKESIWIRKTPNMNRDEGGFKLPHVWDHVLLATTSSGQQKN
ncbi:uncharacterized protein LOC135499347 [Lineus longissimus]|uniref:uncharacterized protein LOC135499347 n=1 Tax=Lineus longissimus TaxID=88925 RepID=UPI00315CA8ED